MFALFRRPKIQLPMRGRPSVMIKLENVSKFYGDSAAIEGVSVTIDRGKTTVLIGPSGSGKSTLLSLIIGLALPDRGAITIDGNPLTSRSAVLLRRRMGYVIQDGGLFPHLTARQNVELMAKEVGWSAEKRLRRMDELAALASFPPPALDRYPGELSGGQRQRVSLMRALMLDPDILLLDEPLGALDPMIRTELQDELKAIFRRLAKTVAFVTHDLAEAAFFGENIILMQGGRVIQQGEFRDLVTRPSDPFVTRFVHAQMRRLATLGESRMLPANGL
ncbi:ATP-binding cassette domain-containing protein [Methylocystis sp. MJC1]|uniref:ATP-binding cassette domain-containing protein n=1 Tax=Methylocystis sp. MJC1 TaxID=2654282 RepID=UPI001FEFA98F|nr:ATP-binding cassette domain-containing protein [Methylocystis sp. MJC1]UZX12922.1 ATP-binding cassette domain-containing protein [Methylocystis sp. MJC1]